MINIVTIIIMILLLIIEVPFSAGTAIPLGATHLVAVSVTTSGEDQGEPLV